MSKLKRDFYIQDDVVTVAQQLIGKVLVSDVDGTRTSGIIVETEAYNGRTDKACHAFPDKRTNRTRTMYLDGGIAYVYLCYGMHHLFNVVTNVKDKADAVLIRVIEPLDGIGMMLERRKMDELKPRVTAGPACVSQALGIKTSDHNALGLCEDVIWIEDQGMNYKLNQLIASPRVGVDYAGEDAALPWRFRLKENRFVSPAK